MILSVYRNRILLSTLLFFVFFSTSFQEVSAATMMQPMTDANLKGIDVSHWNGTIDWVQVKSSGVAFAYVKASEGTTYTDTMFATNVKGAHAANLPVGAYHYARPSAPFNQDQPKQEAQYFVNAMKNNGLSDFGNIMPVLDLEEPATTGTLTSDELAQWARIFVDTTKSLTNRQVLLYTGAWFVQQYNDFGGKLADLPVWIAAYTRYGYTQPPACGGWTQWTAWQYSDQGTVPGVPSQVDLDAGPTTIDALKGNLTVSTAPSTPTNLTATVTTTSAALSWNASTNASSYKLSRNGNVVYQGAATSYTDNGLTSNTSYTYSLTAVNTIGESNPASLSVTTAGSQTVSQVTMDKTQYYSSSYAKITTTVKDSNGNVLSGAAISLSILTPKGSTTTVSGKTDATGKWDL
ncbi:MAG TPA: GH25 family lysozyme [Bacillota bacterium]|nr:GH25 family lysozyme [Bacillota bacterium]